MKFSELIVKYFRVFRKWFIEVFWPWFKKEIWPKVEKYIIEIVISFIVETFNKILAWLKNSRKTNEDIINNKINEAEKKASESKEQSEIDKQRAIANVWREVAEMFRKENEELSNKIKEIEINAKESIKNKLNKIELELKTSPENELLLSTNEQQYKILLPPTLDNTDKGNMGNVFWKINKNIPENDKKLLVGFEGRLFKKGNNMTDIWQSKFDKDLEIVFGSPLIPKYVVDEEVKALNQKLKIKDFDLVEVSNDWQFQYICEDNESSIHNVYESQISKVV
jgi:hypothetical protein